MNSAGIYCASDRDIGEMAPNLPSMRETIMGYFRPLVFTRTVKKQVDYRVEESLEKIETFGAIQPLKHTDLQIKPEGERAWSWWKVHATADLVLTLDDVLFYKGTKYRVKGQGSYDEYGFVSYQLVKDFEGHA